MRRSSLSIVLLLLLGLLLLLISKTSLAADADKLRIYGVATDGPRNHRTGAANGKMELVANTGFNAVRSTVPWVPGQRDLNHRDRAAIRNLIQAAEIRDKILILTVFPWTETKTPVLSSEQWDFVNFIGYLAETFPEVKFFEIGNEPNLSLFWSPQFWPNGQNSSAQTYFRLLARSYDRLKSINPEITVIGGALASKGKDSPWGSYKTSSPTVFIRKLGEAYRKSGRARPVMDWFSIHPYGTDSSEPPDTAHPNSTTIGFADYDNLVALLGEAFDGTAQEGSTIPILYSEYGVDSIVPPEKSHLYKGAELAATKSVTEEMQGVYYRRALELAFCQSTVVGIIFFQITDEPELNRWQSGIYYPNDTPKRSQPLVKAAVKKAKEGGMKC